MHFLSAAFYIKVHVLHTASQLRHWAGSACCWTKAVIRWFPKVMERSINLLSTVFFLNSHGFFSAKCILLRSRNWITFKGPSVGKSMLWWEAPPVFLKSSEYSLMMGTLKFIEFLLFELESNHQSNVPPFAPWQSVGKHNFNSLF